MSLSYVYILTNPAMPDWIKVGKADNIKQRISQLSSRTAVPIPFECYAYMETPRDLVHIAEASLHNLMGLSFDKEKEFFRLSPEKALHYMKLLAPNNPAYKIVVHPDIESVADKNKSSATTFAMLQIPVGSRIGLYRNDLNVECEVADGGNTILYEGKKTTVSAVACEKLGYSVNGFRVFMYENETLWQRRERLCKP